MNKKERFYKLLEENEFVFLDGGMGTMLQKSGLKTGEVPELLNLNQPEKKRRGNKHGGNDADR